MTVTDEQQQPTIGEVIGRNLREWRTASSIRLDDVASAARRWGLAWTRPGVAELEAGRRRLTAEELVLLPVVLNDASGGGSSPTLAELLVGADRLRLSDRASLGREQVEALLASEPPPSALEPPAPADMNELIRTMARESKARRAQHLDLLIDDTEKKASKRLGVPARRVRLVALALWQQPLSAKRDELVEEMAGAAPARSKQALRGHVTRQLMESLAAALAQGVGEEA